MPPKNKHRWSNRGSALARARGQHAAGLPALITCNDGTSGVVDMSALVNSVDAGVFAALKDAHLFQKVGIKLGALTWPNGADLDPSWVHEEIRKNKSWSVPV